MLTVQVENHIKSFATKIFNDNVHGHMKIPQLCSLIINTKEFGRLRNLKQLSFTYYVYPAASHNRFEHSIGTCHLAGKYCRILLKKQPELRNFVTEKDILCVQIAGLCHDLGHGPFSHTWERFIEEYQKQNKSTPLNYNHEKISLMMFDKIEQNLRTAFENEGIDEKDKTFIKEMIFGKPLPGNANFIGRDNKKYFLYQIVSNPETKIDVDKFDYMLRDCRQLNLSIYFDYSRLMNNSRVVSYKSDKSVKNKIAYREKVKETIEDLFNARHKLHKIGYQHHTVTVIDKMFVEGLLKAAPFFKVEGKDKIYSLYNAHEDPVAFLKLTDSIFEGIENHGLGGIEAAKILQNITTRSIGKYIGYISMTKKIAKDISKKLQTELSENSYNLSYTVANLKSKQDSLNLNQSALFYKKDREDEIFKLTFNLGDPEIRYYFTCDSTLSVNYMEAEKYLEDWIAKNIDGAVLIKG